MIFIIHLPCFLKTVLLFGSCTSSLHYVTVTSVTLMELGSLPNAAILLLLSRIFFLTVTLSYYYNLGRRPKKIWEPRKHRYDTPGAWGVEWRATGLEFPSEALNSDTNNINLFTWRWALPQGRRHPQGLYFNFSLHTTQEFAFSEQLHLFLFVCFFFLSFLMGITHNTVKWFVFFFLIVQSQCSPPHSPFIV